MNNISQRSQKDLRAAKYIASRAESQGAVPEYADRLVWSNKIIADEERRKCYISTDF